MELNLYAKIVILFIKIFNENYYFNKKKTIYMNNNLI